jgi:putative cell wall-binding protein
MKRKFLGFVFGFTFILLCGFNAKADSLQVTRLGDFDRYGTNVKIIEQGWQKSDYAIIASGENFPDALSAAPLAKKYNAPVFLTFPPSLSPNADNELIKLGVKKAFIIGGPSSVSTLIEDDLKSKGIDYERIYGADRYQTSMAIANKIGTENGVVVTTGNDFSDSLSIAPIAGKLQMPIILSQQNVLDSIQKKFISENTIPKTYVLGNTDIISDNVASKFPNVQRIAAEDNRFARNLDIINTFSNDINFSTAILASGADFPDALSGTALGALNGNPIILTGSYSLFNDTESANNNSIETLLGNSGTKNIYALGLQQSISDDNLNDISKETKALNTIKSKIQLDSNLEFGIGSNYSHDGSNYYRISLYNYNSAIKTYLTNCYQYDFLVDTETGDTYKLDNNTKGITPLDITNIGTNTLSSNGTLTIDQAMDLVKSKVKLDANETLGFPYEESQRTVVYNGAKCYCIVKDYNETNDPNNADEVCEYLVNINTNEITECNQGQYTPIK